MQQQMFRDALWAVIELSDHGAEDVEAAAYAAMASMHPGVTKSRFEELIDMFVRTDHLRRWSGPTDATGRPLGPSALMPTAKARLQFSIAIGVD